MDEGESCGVINVARVFNEIPTVSSPYDLQYNEQDQVSDITMM